MSADPARAEPTAAPPRVWTVALVIVAGVAALNVGTALALTLHWLAIRDAVDGAGARPALREWIEHATSDPARLLTSIVGGQIALLATVLVAARLSPLGVRERLRLVRGELDAPRIAWIVVVSVGLLVLVQTAGDLLTREASPHMRDLAGGLAGARGVTFALLVPAISVLPGCAEELLFRGYAQSRLIERATPLAAIVTSGMLFALVHGDPQQILLVAPIGLWLGWVAWRMRSTWASIVAHATNNLGALIVLRVAGVDAEGHVATSGAWTAFAIAAVLVGTFAFVRLARVTAPTSPTSRSSS